MAILVSDANIFIDVEVASLTRAMFRLDDTFATPDVLYQQELAEHHAELPGLGLQIERLSGDSVAEVMRLASVYHEPSTNDLFALTLAMERDWPLLSGNRRLKNAADSEGVEVRGTLWLVERLVNTRTIPISRAEAGFESMRNAGRRLPWEQVDELFARLNRNCRKRLSHSE